MARENIGVRLDAKTVKTLDAFVKSETQKTGYTITRARVVRRAITEWLAAHAKPVSTETTSATGDS